MQELQCLHGHKGAILCCKVYFNSFVTAGHDKKITIWEASTGKAKLEIIGHEHLISDLDIYSGEQCSDPFNEPYILSSSWDSSVKVWNLRTGALITKFTSHKTRVKRVRCLPERSTEIKHSAQAVSGDDDGRIYVWDIVSGVALLLLDEHSRFIVSLVVFSTAEGSLCLASASADATICIWNIDISEDTYTNIISIKQTKNPACISSICAIKTASHHLSALTVTDMSTTSALLTPTSIRYTGNKKIPLPEISTTTDLNTCVHNNNTTESIIIAADTLGLIYIYRVQNGVLLARLETKCKIIDLFTSTTARFPYFPSEIDNNLTKNPEGLNRTAIESGQFITTERAVLLAQAAKIKRSNHIITSLTGTGRSEMNTGVVHNTVTTAPLYLYYVPENMSLGCFTLSAADSISASGSSVSSTSSIDAVVNSIISTHLVSTVLCQQLNALKNANIGTHTNTTTSTAVEYRTKRKPSLLLSSKSETHFPTGNLMSENRKLRKNSTYSSGITTAAAVEDDDLSDSEDSGLVLGKGRGTTCAGSIFSSSGGRGGGSNSSSGGVMSVSINPHSTETLPVIQCFSLSNASRYNNCDSGTTISSASTGGIVRTIPQPYVLFGARDGSLYYTHLSIEAGSNKTQSTVGEKTLSSQASMEGIKKPTPIQIRSGAALPPLLDSPHRAAQSVLSQQLSPSARHMAAVAPISPAQASARGFARHHTTDHRSSSSSGSSSRVDSYSIRAKPALLTAECYEEEETTTSEGQRGGAEETDEAGCYHIGKSISEDPLDSVSMTDLLSHYDDLFNNNNHTPRDIAMRTEGTASPLLTERHSPDPDAKTKRLLQRLQPYLNEETDNTLSDQPPPLNHTSPIYTQHNNSTSNSSVCSIHTDFQTIASNSTLQPEFWQAAQKAKKTYNFRRIKLQKQANSPSKPSALYQFSDVDIGEDCSTSAHSTFNPTAVQPYATGNYPGLGANNSLSRRLLNSNSYARGASNSNTSSHRGGNVAAEYSAGRGLARPVATAGTLQRPNTTTNTTTSGGNSRVSMKSRQQVPSRPSYTLTTSSSCTGSRLNPL